MTTNNTTQKEKPFESIQTALSLVAEAGFEPATFGLRGVPEVYKWLYCLGFGTFCSENFTIQPIISVDFFRVVGQEMGHIF